MAKEKNPPKRDDFLTAMFEEQKEFERTHPILDTRYYVDEWRKAYVHWSDPYDDEVPAELKNTYGPFTKAEYEAFLDKYEPEDNGTYEKHEFKTRVENLRHYSYDKWGI